MDDRPLREYSMQHNCESIDILSRLRKYNRKYIKLYHARKHAVSFCLVLSITQLSHWPYMSSLFQYLPNRHLLVFGKCYLCWYLFLTSPWVFFIIEAYVVQDISKTFTVGMIYRLQYVIFKHYHRLKVYYFKVTIVLNSQ